MREQSDLGNKSPGNVRLEVGTLQQTEELGERKQCPGMAMKEAAPACHGSPERPLLANNLTEGEDFSERKEGY